MCIFVLLMICSCIVNKYSLFIQTTHVRIAVYTCRFNQYMVDVVLLQKTSTSIRVWILYDGRGTVERTFDAQGEVDGDGGGQVLSDGALFVCRVVRTGAITTNRVAPRPWTSVGVVRVSAPDTTWYLPTCTLHIVHI